ncbi:MAG TPA: sigma-54 dependent transcriptional regulator [Terriglobales bacterium]|nr:sigma-54 dependent transcriptional regulator [Terriglobales bacterium]
MSSLTTSLPPGDIAVDAASAGVLVVTSNHDLRRSLLARLEIGRWNLLEASSGAEALQIMDTVPVTLLLLDPGLPDLKVEDFKEIIGVEYPDVTIVPINPHTGQPIVASPSPDSLCFEMIRKIERGAPYTVTSAVVEEQEDARPNVEGLPGFIGRTPAVQRVYTMARQVAQRDTSVLITGESGTGKDVVARALHELSLRRLKPFVVVNCAAIPEALLEAELFGFVKGAFTGAVQSKIGRIHAAQGGTLFLDEIGDLALGLQSKLLRFLEQGEVQRLGSNDTFRVDVRVIAATNAPLRTLVQQRAFREDLYYRLSIFPIDLPPLRERMEDLELLIPSFVAKFCPHHVSVNADASSLLKQHSWPGNVRELRNVIERASILVGTGREIGPEHILI